MKIAIVLGYGVFEKSNRNYKNYLDKCLELIQNEQTEKIIFCGGFTYPNFPNISEAKSMCAYCVDAVPEMKNKVIFEEKSISTADNITAAKELVEINKLKPDEVVLIANSIRIPKVFYFTLLTFAGLYGEKISREEIYEAFFNLNKEGIDVTREVELTCGRFKFYGLDMARTKEEIGRQISTTMLELAGSEFPKLAEKISLNRKQRWGLN